jgi:ketosteroid isomerase-like protein
MTPTSATRPLLTEDERIKAEIRFSLAQSASAFKRGDVEAILRAYAPDAVVLPPNSPAIQGIPAIRQLWKSLLAAGYRNATLQFDQIQHWGDVALVMGRYTVEISSIPGALGVDRGSYVGHWRRMADGQFRVTLSVWSSDRWRHPGHQ